MSNPNNCAACEHKQNPDGGWCYMFREEPQAVCLKHTARRGMTVAELIDDLYAMRRRREAWVNPQPPDHDCALRRGSVMCRVCDLDTIAAHSKTPNVGAKRRRQASA